LALVKEVYIPLALGKSASFSPPKQMILILVYC